MEIQKVIPSGFCKGVVNAINIARKTRKDNPGRDIYVLGMLVHNDHVTRELEKDGIITLDDSVKTKSELLDDIDEGIVIFTAHGISDEIKNKAMDKGLECVDATCTDVLKTQNIIREHIDEGYDVLYFGKNNHPEAQAILAISDRIHLLTSEKDIESLDLDNPKLFLTNQTTMSFLQLKDLIERVRKKYPDVIVQEEICNATSARQMAIHELTDCDLLYVVGDRKSNNSNMLVETALKHGIKKALLIQSYTDIDDDDLAGVNKVCVSAGASTPPGLIDEVMNYLSAKTSEQ
ncbi:MAG: 4-hydroxy-3-methylbut-2-enyl diphosphate reductase [Erysipelotrichaceae bacterium]|nr:4-hydroxy-3-methylbut-2-enyl diphosphate reductase [Erysipelotrichaceae bacterium]